MSDKQARRRMRQREAELTREESRRRPRQGLFETSQQWRDRIEQVNQTRHEEETTR